jgi:hypothetical protein
MLYSQLLQYVNYVEVETDYVAYTTAVPFSETGYANAWMIGPRGLWPAANMGLKVISSTAAAGNKFATLLHYDSLLASIRWLSRCFTSSSLGQLN